MKASRIRVAAATTLLGIGLLATPAQALEGQSFSDSPPQRSEVLPSSESLPANELAFTDDAPETAPAAQGTLPFTGGDVAGMVLMGAAAVGIGAVMVRRSRPRSAE